MKHLIILSLLTLPLIACRSLNTYQKPDEAPEDPGQKANEVQEDPVVSNPMNRAIDELRKIVEWDSIKTIENNNPEYDTRTFKKTYSSQYCGQFL